MSELRWGAGPAPVASFVMVVVLLLTVVEAVGPATAQDEPSQAPGAEALALLPDATLFGADWGRQADPLRLVPADAFRDGALVAFGGPSGARVVLAALLVRDDRVAVRAAWEAAGKIYDRYRNDLTHDDGLEEALAAAPPPAGCVEAKRTEGPSERDTFPTGVTLCAGEADPDLIVLVVASGAVRGLTGYQASDAVVTAVLGAASVARGASTPTP